MAASAPPEMRRPAALPAPAGASPRGILTALVAIGLGVRLAIVWSGLADRELITDDAYYYFTIARNLAAGLGSTFDGLAPTNGFHPLFLLLVTPIFALARAAQVGPWIPVHVAASLCAVLDVLAALVLYRLVRACGAGRGAGWAAGIWLLSPYSVLIGLRGVENTLTVSLIAVTMLLAARWLKDGPPPDHASRGTRRAAALGALVGLATLARTDNAPLLGLTLVVQLVVAARRAPREAWSGGRWRAALGALAVAALVAGVIVAPWVLWNLRVFGSPLQVSGLAKMGNGSLFGHLPTASGPWTPARVGLSLIAPVWVPTRFLLGEEYSRPLLARLLTAAVVLAACAAFAIALRNALRTGSRMALVTLAGTGTYVVLHMLAYALVLRAYFTWYSTVPLFLVCVDAGLAVGPAPAHPRRSVRGVAIALAAVALSLAIGVRFFRSHPPRARAPEIAIGEILATIAHEAPGAHTIGIYNAGSAGYFAPEFGPYHVVDLDCVVNNVAFAAFRRGEYAAYLRRTVDVLLLSPPGVEPRPWMPRPEYERLFADYPRWEDRLQPADRNVEIYGPRR